MGMVYGGLSVWPDIVYCPGHQVYEYHDYRYPHEHWYDYSYPPITNYPVVAERSPGVEMTENCRYCFQSLIATSDRRVDYCPNCGRTQWHRP
jgi:hypothetical protein